MIESAHWRRYDGKGVRGRLEFEKSSGTTGGDVVGKFIGERKDLGKTKVTATFDPATKSFSYKSHGIGFMRFIYLKSKDQFVCVEG